MSESDYRVRRRPRAQPAGDLHASMTVTLWCRILVGVALLGAFVALPGTFVPAAGAQFKPHPLSGGLTLADAPLAPYEWVAPPPDRVRDNKIPGPGAGSISLPLQGASSVSTPEGQATLLFETTPIPVPAGQSSVSVTLVPADAATIGKPPQGLAHNSNAYRIAALYEPSGTPVSGLNLTVALVYASPSASDRILRWTGSAWDALQTTLEPQTRVAHSSTSTLGVFVVADATGGKSGGHAPRLILVLAGAAVLLVAVAALLFIRRRRAPRSGSR